MEGSVFIMSGNYAVFVTDKRQEHLCGCLPGKVRAFDWRGGIKEEEALTIEKSCDYLVMPTPVSKLERKPEIDKLLNDKLIKMDGDSKIFFGGAMQSTYGQKLKESLNQAGCEYHDLMEEPEVQYKNARITAEATLAEILKYSEYSIRCQKILVCGYGKCGRETANLLSAVGAKVTVLARSREARRLARAEGHEATDFSYGPEEVYGARTIVNTVPAPVIREPMIREMHSDAVIIDIASRPGGCDLMAADHYGIKVVAALGLPGIYTTKSSAKVLADAIISYTETEKVKKGEKAWIFQIAI
jgi:dipicolinate synthase subunit A